MGYQWPIKHILLTLITATAISLFLSPTQFNSREPSGTQDMSSATSKLFTPIKVGASVLKHRVVMGPMTRFRATEKEHVPIVDLMKPYYSQRAQRPGTLLITEATFISPRAGGYNAVPGIWSDAQISAWKEITDSVHAHGSFIYLQLWALGRAANPAILGEDGFDQVSASSIAIAEGKGTPRELTVDEIQQYIRDYTTAARNAVEGAGFDGVELHFANGYLPDQFLQDVSNKRTDEYGGSVEARSRFGLEIAEAVVKAIGAERTGIRLSPWGTFQSMKMTNPVPQFSHFVRRIKEAHPDLSFIHLVEPEAAGDPSESNDFIRDIWAPRPLVTCGLYNRDTAIARADEKGDLIGFARWYISNPDLPTRLEKNIPLSEYNEATFYTHGSPVGYIDYPFAEDKQA